MKKVSQKVRFTTNLDKDLLYKMKVYSAKHQINLNDIIEKHFISLLEKSFKDIK